MVTLTQEQRAAIRACSKDEAAFDQIMALLEDVSLGDVASPPQQPLGGVTSFDVDQHRLTLDSMGDAIHVVDATLHLTFFNAAFRQLNQRLGLETEVIGLPLSTVFPFLPESVYEEYQRVFETDEILITEEQVTIDDNQFVTETRKIPVLDGDTVTHIITVMRDITERKRAEQALVASEERYRMVSELISDYAFSYQIAPDSTLIHEWLTDDSFTRVTGYARQEIDIQGTYNLFHPDDMARAEQDIQRVIAGETTNNTYRIITKQGEVRWLQVYRYPEWDDRHQRVIRFYGIAQDITERKQVEQSLRESEAKFRSIIEQSYDSIVLVDNQGRIVEWNRGQEQLTGLMRADVLGQSLSAILKQLRPEVSQYADGENLHKSQLNMYLRGEGGQFDRVSEIDIQQADGQIRTLQMASFPIIIEQGQMICAISRDITLQKQVEHDLRRQSKLLEAVMYAAEQFLRVPTWEKSILAVLQRLGEAIAVDRVYVFRNHTAENGDLLTSRLYIWTAPGIPPQKNDSQVQNVSWQASGFARWEAALSQGEIIAGNIATFPDQERETLTQREVVSLIAVPIFVGSVWWGHIGFNECSHPREWTTGESETLRIAANTLGAAIERKQAERQTLALEMERERTNILTRFIRDASHEFRTPLSVINMNLHMLITTMDRQTREIRAERIQEQVMYINRIVDSLVTMSRLDSDEPFAYESVSLNNLCHEVWAAIQAAPEAQDRHLVIHLADDLSRVWGDPLQIHMALTNVLDNAVRYTPAGGQITLRSYMEADQVVVSVSDTGIGISEKALPHIFERFYRVDDAHSTRGLGLGLPIAQKIIERLDGCITVESRLGQGSTFKFYLPTAAK